MTEHIVTSTGPRRVPATSGTRRRAAGRRSEPSPAAVGDDPAGRPSDRELIRDAGAAGAARREAALDALIRRYGFIAQRAARRYARHGELHDELVQTGYVGLMKAIRGFDPTLGKDFAAYARPTVTGEIKRYFRDRRRWVQLPRRIQELRQRIKEAGDELTQHNGHAPTAAELAGRLGKPEHEIAEAMSCDDNFTPQSLDAPIDDPSGDARIDRLGDEDGRLDLFTDTEAVRPLLAALPMRERQIIMLRFYGNQTQREIAERFGLSQMHISRILDQTMRSLREALSPASPAA